MAKTIMIQGTMSGVGKSLLCAGLCRIFTQDGYRTAPFKSQNMALNSFITRDGHEMGRAQVVQAEACKIEPDVRMNPILLKPTTDVGSQVIVNGRVLGNMEAWKYFGYKKKLIPEVKRAYESLANEFDIIVIEGAGSPAEINLKQDDIVNMGMAKFAHAPVLLAGDIDRGGVFAQLCGTLLLLTEEERRYVQGLIINKFRGDKTILEPGLAMLEEKAGKPVAGVIPYERLNLDEEDSLSERLKDRKEEDGGLIIAVIRFPRIANYTDFRALERLEGISLHYTVRPEDLKTADLIILPGSKSTIADLNWMKKNGLEEELYRQYQNGKLIMGICGGYQMLGEQLNDPTETEGEQFAQGLGFLPVQTSFYPDKIRVQSEGTVASLSGVWKPLTGARLNGYEIHMGRSIYRRDYRKFAILSSAKQGTAQDDGCVMDNVLGTYLHGIFDSREFTERFLTIVCRHAGKKNVLGEITDFNQFKEEEYDRLADLVRHNLDMDFVYQVLERGMED
ncbi:cobyric acid synthase [Anaerolentibacter hominis]|uniref:cobyric acid synthase n=1 Tax=Anaerolentibacter hominis TaxID=3079009 RepID=UPI0031B8AC81